MGAYLALGVLLGFAVAAQRSGLVGQIADAWAPAAAGGEPPGQKEAKPAPKLKELDIEGSPTALQLKKFADLTD